MEFVGCYAYSQKDPHEAIDFFVEFCQEYGNTTVDMDSIYTAYENYTAKVTIMFLCHHRIIITIQMCLNLIFLKKNGKLY